MRKVLFLLCVTLYASAMAFGQAHHTNQGGITDTFLFIPGDDGFYRLEGNNEAELHRLYAYVDQHKSAIRSGQLPVHVHGYSSGLATETANLHTAKIRSNRVKSELITHKGLREEDFRTVNSATSYEGHKSAVVVRIGTVKAVAQECPHKGQVEALEKAQKAEMEKLTSLQNRIGGIDNRVKVLENAEPAVDEAKVAEMIAAYDAAKMAAKHTWREPYAFAFRTNFLDWAVLLPNLGIEWRVGSVFGIKVDGAYSNWKFEENRSHKIWFVNPELRFYMGQEKRIYLGLGGNFGKADMSWKPFSRLFTADHGYKGKFWNAGLIFGYQARLSNKLSLDLNLGFGMSRFNYDTYQVSNTGRVNLATGQKKDTWGVTQAGVTLVWRLGRKNWHK